MVVQASKIRTFGLVAGAAVVLYLVMSFFTKSAPNSAASSAQMSGAPKMESIPGSAKDNQEYRDLQVQANKERATQAKQAGNSSVSTLVNKTKEDQSDEDLFNELKKKNEKNDKKDKEDALKKAQADAERRLKEQQDKVDAMKREQDQRRNASETARLKQLEDAAYQKKLDELTTIIQGEITSLTAGYKPPIKQVYVKGNASSTSSNANAGTPGRLPLYKKGSIIYAVISNDVNTDEPGPVLAKITSGPLTGATLIGTAQPGTEWSKGMNVNFNTITLPFTSRSQSISASAVDPEKLTASIASSVNHHYLLKYGTMFLSGVLSSASGATSSAGSSSGNSSSSSSSGSSSQSSTTTTNNNTSNTLLSSLGTVVSSFSSDIEALGSRPTTYKLYQGTAVGLLILDDFVIEP